MTFEIAHKWVLFIIPLPLLVWWLLPAVKTQQTAMFSSFFAQIQKLTKAKDIRTSYIRSRNLWQLILLIICWLLVLFALSSPQFVGKAEKKLKTSRNFLIAADLSISMNERDWPGPNGRVTRWLGVKEVLKNFVEEREGDRIGLVFFGSQAYVQAPFTSDLNLIQQLMADTYIGMAGQMTAIGNAIAKGIEMFKNDTIEHKVMLLLTDGVDSGSDIRPIDAANMAARDSIIIYTLGIGQKGMHAYELDEAELTAIAEATGGKYFKADDNQSLEEVTKILNKIEPMEYEEEEYKPVTLLYYYPLGAMLGIGLFYFFVLGLVRLFRRE